MAASYLVTGGAGFLGINLCRDLLALDGRLSIGRPRTL